MSAAPRARSSGGARAKSGSIDSDFAQDALNLEHFRRRTGIHFGGKCSSRPAPPAGRGVMIRAAGARERLRRSRLRAAQADTGTGAAQAPDTTGENEAMAPAEDAVR